VTNFFTYDYSPAVSLPDFACSIHHLATWKRNAIDRKLAGRPWREMFRGCCLVLKPSVGCVPLLYVKRCQSRIWCS